jgi:hypothetical protein
MTMEPVTPSVAKSTGTESTAVPLAVSTTRTPLVTDTNASEESAVKSIT